MTGLSQSGLVTALEIAKIATAKKHHLCREVVGVETDLSDEELDRLNAELEKELNRKEQ